MPRGSALCCFFHDELGRGVRLETIVWDGKAAPDREAEGSLLEPALGPVDRSQPFTQATGNGVIDLLGSQAFCRIGDFTRFVAGSRRQAPPTFRSAAHDLDESLRVIAGVCVLSGRDTDTHGRAGQCVELGRREGRRCGPGKRCLGCGPRSLGHHLYENPGTRRGRVLPQCHTGTDGWTGQQIQDAVLVCCGRICRNRCFRRGPGSLRRCFEETLMTALVHILPRSDTADLARTSESIDGKGGTSGDGVRGSRRFYRVPGSARQSLHHPLDVPIGVGIRPHRHARMNSPTAQSVEERLEIARGCIGRKGQAFGDPLSSRPCLDQSLIAAIFDVTPESNAGVRRRTDQACDTYRGDGGYLEGNRQLRRRPRSFIQGVDQRLITAIRIDISPGDHADQRRRTGDRPQIGAWKCGP